MTRSHQDGPGTKSARDLLGLRSSRGPDEGPEFPAGADLPPAGITRRDVLKLAGASAALAGLTGCPTRPTEHILPYADSPPELTPGMPQTYATSMVIDGFATGLLAQSNAGRPTKLEGNPDHPASLGGTSCLHQASVLDLYHPQRLPAVRRDGALEARPALAQALANTGPAPWIVMPPQSSPLIAKLLGEVRQRHPDARVCFHSPVDRSAVYSAARACWGRPVDQQYDFTRADRVLALDADFMAGMPMSVRWARDYAQRRRVPSPSGDPGRFYVVEPSPTATGSLADHRLRARASEVAAIGAAVLTALFDVVGVHSGAPDGLHRLARRSASQRHRRWAEVVARDLASFRGSVIVIAGDQQPIETHLLAHLLNAALDSYGSTIEITDPALVSPEGESTLAELAQELDAGRVSDLIILESNPAYTAPGDLGLADKLGRASNRFHLSLLFDETSRRCNWVVPAAHYLETWGDARAYDGTLSLVQPLIRPLHDGSRSTVDILAMMAGNPEPDGHQLLRDAFEVTRSGDAAWKRSLQRGLVDGTQRERRDTPPSWTRATRELERALANRPSGGGIELVFDTSPTVYDGRFASNAWLQELPHPMSKLTWDNAAIVSPATAARLGVKTGQRVRIDAGDSAVTIPALILPGHADDVVSVALGYGQRGDDRVSNGVGEDVYPLRTSTHGRFRPDVSVTRTSGHHRFAITQDHWRMYGRDVALHSTLEHYRHDADFTREHWGTVPTMLPTVFDYDQPEQWGMTIDTTICTGCSACMVACQAENNVPVVGREGVRRSREMHWLRIDRYFSAGPEEPEIVNQPMMCQHCEHAPCEYVCPVFATTHSPDGLNEMTYNRCIGTRFCSNNCPYKVRRFNYLLYGPPKSSSLALQKNPDVTVRQRGVMEKCTYCVQRIRRTGIAANIEKRRIRPGEVRTACQQACPTGAIQFGSLMHHDTAMVRWRDESRHYAVLNDLGTRPRTVYLAKIRNPNPEIP